MVDSAGARPLATSEPEKDPSLPDEGREMTLMEHMIELRDRLIKAVLALAIGTIIGFVVAEQAFRLLISPLPEAAKVVALSPTDTIISYFKVSLVIGTIIGMPVILYELLQFVLPGLYPNEQRYLYYIVPAATVAFAGGAVFAALVVVPFSIRYLSGFLAYLVSPTYQIQSYIGFVSSLMFWIGIVFEMPLVIFFLAKLKIINYQKLSSSRKYAIVLIAVLAAVITPTPDPFTMMIVMVPLVILYEIGVQLARVA